MTSFAPAYEARIATLEAAIRKHRDYEGDDRCWQDDAELYAVLPEGYTPPKVALMMPELERCERYLACRENPNIRYVSPVGEIQRLRALVKQAYEEGASDWDASVAKANLAPQVTGMQSMAVQDAHAVAVEDLPLPSRVRDVLLAAGIKTLGRLAEQRPRDLLALKGFGGSGLYAVRFLLAEYGLALAAASPDILELAKQRKLVKDAAKSETQRRADAAAAEIVKQKNDIRQWVYDQLRAFVGVNGIRFATQQELDQFNKGMIEMAEQALFDGANLLICDAVEPQPDDRKGQTGYVVRVRFRSGCRSVFTAKLPDGSCGFNFTENFADAMADFI